VKVRAEEGFNPHTDLDIASLRFGAFGEVNFGRGSKVLRTKAAGRDLIITFNGKGSGITADEWAPKLIGKDAKGQTVFGYARLPYVDYQPALLSARRPRYDKEQGALMVNVENYGLSASQTTEVEVLHDGQSLGRATIEPLAPYASATATFAVEPVDTEHGTFEVVFYVDGKELERNTFTR
jgi:hypothetical protein